MILGKKFKKIIDVSNTKTTAEIPDGLVIKCNKCKKTVYTKDVKDNLYICPKCGGYFRIGAKIRIKTLVDDNTFECWDEEFKILNPLNIEDYKEKIYNLQQKTGIDEAIITGCGNICGMKAAIGIMDGRFMMASMGSVVGERIVNMIEKATKENLPVVIFSCSGGARMQEGIVSLMQMAKTSGAIKKHSDKGLLYISVLTDPTTGGVTASFAMEGDIILAEPKALIGFAGPRVIEQTIKEKLPEGFQKSEFLLKNGFVDKIIQRENLKNIIGQILKLHSVENVLKIKSDIYIQNELLKDTLSPWDRVVISRDNKRPTAKDYINKIVKDFIELHGDRCYKDDKAIIGGIGTILGKNVTIIAQCKGKNTKENIEKNFGMPSPDGYRKALRLAKQAEKFNRPIICLVDTPGAFCGIEAEQRGQGQAIANMIFNMCGIKVPILSIIIGEGGSGGALAFAVANQVWMLKNSVYSILSPEGYASILWKDSKKAKDAANMMGMTSFDVKKLGIIEEIIDEPVNYTEENMDSVCIDIENKIYYFLEKYENIPKHLLVEERYHRYRNM